MKRILFIQNPIAGRRHQKLQKKEVERFLGMDTYIELITTRDPGDASRIVLERLDDFDIFVAVGGDGTVNEVGKGLIGTDKILAIIPAGSGNGLARELGMNLDRHIALIQIAEFNLSAIDTITINSSPCLNVTGLGFEAEVAHHFKSQKRRGFSSYARSVVQLLSSYRPLNISMEVNGETVARKVFSISFSNSRQFGYNAYNSPLAGVSDGAIDVSLIKPFPIVLAPELTLRLFNKTLHRSWFYEVFKTENIRILNSGEMRCHIDGEPVIVNGPLDITIRKKSLKVLMGNDTADQLLF